MNKRLYNILIPRKRRETVKNKRLSDFKKKKKKIQESERAAEEVRQRRGGNKRAEIRWGGGTERA